MVVRGLKKEWVYRGRWLVKDLPRFRNNAFLISFEVEADKKMVLERCPWNIQGELFIIVDWHLSILVNGLRFDEAPFWAHAMVVPHVFLMEDNAVTIAKKVGKLLVMDLDLKRDRWRGFSRFKVSITVAGQLFPGFFLATGNGKPSWVQIKYDRLANFCFPLWAIWP
ncbi:hypothetical protein UlMin_027403 [Ulmus minor]